jgi:Phosphodiester glycosidase
MATPSPASATSLGSRPGTARRPTLERRRLQLADGATTTLHVARFRRARTRLRVVAFERPLTLVAWCRERGVADAMIGGFFLRGAGTPLGELRVDGAALAHEPFLAPWHEVRACLHVEVDRIRLGPRCDLETEPPGDLLQAGPLLVRDGVSLLADEEDAEGFSAGAAQFDSDITAGRYPRAALGLDASELIAVACDGRAAEDAGLTLAELAETMVALGAAEAINLDGGGSAALVVNGELRNRPREQHGLPLPGGRPIATALAFEPLA